MLSKARPKHGRLPGNRLSRVEDRVGVGERQEVTVPGETPRGNGPRSVSGRFVSNANPIAVQSPRGEIARRGLVGPLGIGPKRVETMNVSPTSSSTERRSPSKSRNSSPRAAAAEAAHSYRNSAVTVVRRLHFSLFALSMIFLAIQLWQWRIIGAAVI
jgi:hypothetical protein